MNRKNIGTLFLIIGILAWPVGYALKLTVMPNLRPVPDILFVHLFGVIPGVLLRGSKILNKIKGD